MTDTDPKILYYGGVDPGVYGAIATIEVETGQAYVMDMPWKMTDVHAHFSDFPILGTYVGIENPQPVPMQPARDIATFWEHIGAIEGILLSVGIPFMKIRPQDWRKGMGVSAKSTQEAKRRSIEMAKKLFPYVDLGKRSDAGRAEALLVAEFTKRCEYMRRWDSERKKA